MKEKYLDFILDMFTFKIIKDEHNNEYVVFKNNPNNYMNGIEDKTQLNAILSIWI